MNSMSTSPLMPMTSPWSEAARPGSAPQSRCSVSVGPLSSSMTTPHATPPPAMSTTCSPGTAHHRPNCFSSGEPRSNATAVGASRGPPTRHHLRRSGDRRPRAGKDRQPRVQLGGTAWVGGAVDNPAGACQCAAGGQAAGRIPDPVVRTELAYLQSQQVKRAAAEQMSQGNVAGALGQSEARAVHVVLGRRGRAGSSAGGHCRRSQRDQDARGRGRLRGPLPGREACLGGRHIEVRRRGSATRA